MNELVCNGLTDNETEFVYNVEVLMLPVRVAASKAGLSMAVAVRPHIMEARRTVRDAMRASLEITREDVINGMRDAIDRARIIGEPMTELVGWEKIAKLLGFEPSKRVDINLTASIDATSSHVRRLSDAELIRMAGADNVIDAEFYDVSK
jgi:hypothetical protein